MDAKLICLHDDAFYALVEEVVARIKEKENIKEDKWIPTEVAMKKLGIKSKATLQKYRDEGRIRFTQGDKKIILYDSKSIDDYLDNNANETF